MAYFGFLEVGQPKAGETLVVSAVKSHGDALRDCPSCEIRHSALVPCRRALHSIEILRGAREEGR